MEPVTNLKCVQGWVVIANYAGSWQLFRSLCSQSWFCINAWLLLSPKNVAADGTTTDEPIIKELFSLQKPWLLHQGWGTLLSHCGGLGLSPFVDWKGTCVSGIWASGTFLKALSFLLPSQTPWGKPKVHTGRIPTCRKQLMFSSCS